MSAPKSTTPITLYRGFPGTGTYTWSPFVIKLEARMRFAGIPYRVEAGSLANAPRGKVPYISILEKEADGSGSVLLGDSAVITKMLIERGLAEDLNTRLLSGTEKLQDMGLRALLEDKLYFYGTYEKWVTNYYTMRDAILATVPWPLRVLIGLKIYRKVSRNLTGQGTMLCSAEEIGSSRLEIWVSINAALVESRSRHLERGGQGPFWLWGGEEPAEADAVLFGFVVSGLICYA
ncbi:hypothetical protein BBP40_006570 [Aspergillus hancockii]|nr:hypothetical protein BBP40_006570 [Aspergillus hancockii]